jgi:hypothetical protein
MASSGMEPAQRVAQIGFTSFLRNPFARRKLPEQPDGHGARTLQYHVRCFLRMH